ncbi:MAG: lipopolysaccharide biosynthesis protein [Flavobacteriaceae bacterium]
MNLLERIKHIFLGGQARTARAKKNVLLTIVLKGLGVLIGFVYFRLSVDYLGEFKFGIFLTLLSLIDWFLNFDLGIGQGLRNKFGESVAHQNDEDAVHYVSTAYFSLGAIILLVTLTLAGLNYLLPWPEWLNIPSDLVEEVRLLGLVVIVAFGIQFVARNIYEIFYALQKMAYVEFFTFLTKASFLILVLVIPFIVSDSLLLFGSAKSLTFALVPLIVGLYFFKKKFYKYRPVLAQFRRDYFKDLFTLGLKFFVIKLAMLVIHQTNNILIASFVSLEGVSRYESAFKYLSVFSLLFVILNNQLWPSNIEAYAKGEIDWMKKTMKVVLKIWGGTVILAGLMVLLSPYVYDLWLEDKVQVSLNISIAVAISICLTTWVNMFNIVLNGTGKIKLQMYIWIIAAGINIPASLFFVKVMDLGVVVIVLGTIISLLPLAVVSPIQVKKILAGKERGVWGQ